MSSELENKILTDLLIKKVIEEKRAYEDSNRQLRIEIPDYYNQETYRKKKEIKEPSRVFIIEIWYNF